VTWEEHTPSGCPPVQAEDEILGDRKPGQKPVLDAILRNEDEPGAHSRAYRSARHVSASQDDTAAGDRQQSEQGFAQFALAVTGAAGSRAFSRAIGPSRTRTRVAVGFSLTPIHSVCIGRRLLAVDGFSEREACRNRLRRDDARDDLRVLMRHFFALAVARAIRRLPRRVSEPTGTGPLVPAAGAPERRTPSLASTRAAAVPMSAITRSAEQEQLATIRSDTNDQPQRLHAPPRSERGGWTITTAVCEEGALNHIARSRAVWFGRGSGVGRLRTLTLCVVGRNDLAHLAPRWQPAYSGRSRIPRFSMSVDKRTFLSTIGVGLLAAPLVVDAQQPEKVARIGYLAAGCGSGTAYLRPLEAFRRGLRELGWIEGQNVQIEYRFAEGRLDRLPGLADELVRLKVDLIAASPMPAALAARDATRAIPIVGMSLTEPHRRPTTCARCSSRPGSGSLDDQEQHHDGEGDRVAELRAAEDEGRGRGLELRRQIDPRHADLESPEHERLAESVARHAHDEVGGDPRVRRGRPTAATQAFCLPGRATRLGVR
jgi:hypothetical protein